MAAFFRCLRLGGEAIEVCGALIADQRATVGLATGTLRRLDSICSPTVRRACGGEGGDGVFPRFQLRTAEHMQGSQRVAVAGLAWVEGRGQIPATDLLRASVGISPEVARFYANSEDGDVYHSVGQKPRVCRDSYPRSEGPCQGRIVGLTDSGGNDLEAGA
jgi:hypothetical protein